MVDIDLSKMGKKQKKDGMQLEKDIVKKWNEGMGNTSYKQKKYNTKKVFSFEDEEVIEKEETINEHMFKRDKTHTKKTMKSNTSLVGSSKENEAKQQVNSGALWFSKGDIRLEHAIMEAKHRGTKNGRGRSTISIHKDWLDEQKKEALFEGKDFWYLPFAYKDSKDIYLIKDFDHEIEMVQEIRKLFEENELLKAKILEMEKNKC